MPDPNLRDLERAAVLDYLGKKVALARRHETNVCQCVKTHNAAEQEHFGNLKHAYGALAGELQAGFHLREDSEG